MATQATFPFWDKVIDKKQAAIKSAKLERRNEWIKNNLSKFKHDSFDEPNLKGMR